MDMLDVLSVRTGNHIADNLRAGSLDLAAMFPSIGSRDMDPVQERRR